MSAALTVVLATLSSVITAYGAHLISLPHFHLLAASRLVRCLSAQARLREWRWPSG